MSKTSKRLLVLFGLATIPAFGGLITSVSASATLVDSRTLQSVSQTCSGSTGCGVYLTLPDPYIAGGLWGNAVATAQASYGSVGENLSSDANCMHCGSAGASGSASFTDSISLFGTPDYQFVQFTFSGLTEWIIAGEIGGGPVYADLLLGSSDLPVQMAVSPYGLLFQTIQTPLLLLPGANQFNFGLSVSGGLGDNPINLTEPESIYTKNLSIDSIQFFDANQNPISTVYYSDVSGTVYPIDGGEFIPEPGTAGLLCIGFGLLGLGRWGLNLRSCRPL